MYLTENQKIESAYRKMYEPSPKKNTCSKGRKRRMEESSFFSNDYRDYEEMRTPDARKTPDTVSTEQKLIEEWQKISPAMKNEYIDSLIYYLALYVANGRLDEGEIKSLLYNALSFSSTDKPYSVLIKLINNAKIRQAQKNGRYQ